MPPAAPSQEPEQSTVRSSEIKAPRDRLLLHCFCLVCCRASVTAAPLLRCSALCAEGGHAGENILGCVQASWHEATFAFLGWGYWWSLPEVQVCQPTPDGSRLQSAGLCVNRSRLPACSKRNVVLPVFSRAISRFFPQ